MRWMAVIAALGFWQDAPSRVEASRIREHLAYLAGDELEGRLAGYPGNDKAAEYLAKHLEKLGFKPLGDANDAGQRTYLQKFHPDAAKKLTTQNIVGYLEGSDEALKKECIILGAHFDHVGTSRQSSNPGRIGRPGENDVIWNGADDNASGSAALMEAARVLVESKAKFKRSIVIIWFSAEEWGLLGSMHFVRRPPEEFPLDRMVAMLNMDMVGRNPDRPCSVSGTGTCEEWERVLDEAARSTGASFKYSRPIGGGSDHATFAGKKIPAVHFFTGFHPDYHRFSDHADQISYDHAAKIGQTVLLAALGLSNLDKRPAWTGGGSSNSQPRGRRLGVHLGPDAVLGADEAQEAGLENDQGGIRIAGVEEDGVSSRGGLKPGDILIEFNGKQIPRNDPLEKLRELIRQAPEGFDIPVVILRGKQRVRLLIRWGEKKSLMDLKESAAQLRAAAEMFLRRGR